MDNFLSELRFETLLAKKNVIGIMAGVEERNGSVTSTPAIVCLVRKKEPITELKLDDIIPGNFHGLPTDVIEVGEINSRAAGHIEKAMSHRRRHRPLVLGISIGYKDSSAGSIGLFVEKKGEPYILSNNHVIANLNNASIGDPIIQPARTDGGKHNDVVAHLSEFVPIDFNGNSFNLVDVALAKIYKPENTNSAESEIGDTIVINSKGVKKFSEFVFDRLECEIRNLTGLSEEQRKKEHGLYRVKDINSEINFVPDLWNLNLKITGKIKSNVKVGDFVQKSGRSSGDKGAHIIGINAIAEVKYADGSNAFFKNQIITGPFSDKGDSGSAVFDRNGDFIGIICGGNDKITVINRAEDIMTALKIERIISDAQS